MKKILYSIAFCFVVGLGLSSTSLASNVDSVVQKSNNINVNSSVEHKLTDEMKDYFTEEAKTNGNITIHNIKEVEPGDITIDNVQEIDNAQEFEQAKVVSPISPLKPENEVQPLGLIYNYNVTFSNVRLTNGARNFIISVAKGQTKKLTKSQTFGVTSGVTAVTGASMPNAAKAEVQAKLESSQSVTYTTSTTWTGSPNSSKAVSRNYYVTFFYNTGNFKVTRTTKLTGNKTYYNGTFREASHYVEWSEDIY